MIIIKIKKQKIKINKNKIKWKLTSDDYKSFLEKN